MVKRPAMARKRQITLTEFLDNCLPETRNFFSSVVAKATERGFKILWGTLGFTVRAKLTENDSYVTFVSCYPPDKFQYYFDGQASIPRDKDSPMRRKLLDLGVFSETGEYTLTAPDTAENAQHLEQVSDQILDMIEQYESSRRQ